MQRALKAFFKTTTQELIDSRSLFLPFQKDCPTRGLVASEPPPKLISIPAYRYMWAQEAISIGFKPSKERRSETDSITLDPNPTCVRAYDISPTASSPPTGFGNGKEVPLEWNGCWYSLSYPPPVGD